MVDADRELKAAVMKAYSKLVRNEEFMAARKLFLLLCDGVTYLQLDDASYRAECILEALGCAFSYSRSFSTAEVHLVRKRGYQCA